MIELRPQKGPQEQFIATPASICIYGGAAGGGKSYGLLLSALRYKNVPGFGCTIFRRNYNQIFSQGGLWDEARSMYGNIPGAVPKEGRGQWWFKDEDGDLVSKVTFSYIERDSDTSKWQGSQICELCCEENTPVLMSDGSYKLLKDIRIGDVVQTLQGGRAVTAIGNARTEPCVEVVTESGEKQTQTVDHKILTQSGWLSFDDCLNLLSDSCSKTLQPTVCRFVPQCDESLPLTNQEPLKPRHKKQSHPRQECEYAQQEPGHPQQGCQNDCKWSEPHPPLTCEPTECCYALECGRCSQKRCQASLRPLDSRTEGRRQEQSVFQSTVGHQDSLETAVCTEQQGLGSCSGWFLDCTQDNELLLSDHHEQEPVPQGHELAEGTYCSAGVPYGLPCVRILNKQGDCQESCSSYSRQYDGLLRMEEETGASFSLQLSGAVAHSPTCSLLDAPGRTHRDTRRPLLYEHPYTGKVQLAKNPGVHFETLKITPVGERRVIPITVESENYYITKSGLVNRNCFDELTHFTKNTFFYMLSRNRSTCGVSPFVRATCNPDADSWVAEFISWWIDQDTGYPIPERSGKIRWFIRRNDTIHWANKKQTLIERFNLRTEEEQQEPRSVTFIMSKLSDNKKLMEINPAYLANLKALPLIERERLLYGNWKIKAAGGMFFKRSQVDVISVMPTDLRAICRAWDLAASEDKESGDPDYTAGVLMGVRKDGTLVVLDVVNQRIKAGEVEKLIYNTAVADRAKYGMMYKIRIPQDPGAAGKIVAKAYIKKLSGFSIKALPVTGSKQLRATPFAAQWQNGNVVVMAGAWNDSYFAQLESFPESKHDDMVDASSDAFNELTGSGFNIKNLI